MKQRESNIVRARICGAYVQMHYGNKVLDRFPIIRNKRGGVFLKIPARTRSGDIVHRKVTTKGDLFRLAQDYAKYLEAKHDIAASARR